MLATSPVKLKWIGSVDKKSDWLLNKIRKKTNGTKQITLIE